MTKGAPVPPSSSTGRFAGWLWGWTKSIVVALAVWFALSTFLVQAFRIPSNSMERTVLIGDFLFVNKMLYGAEVPLTGLRLPAIREPRHDEIVVIKSPLEDLVLIKRLVALPGDTVAMVAGRLIRNGNTVSEPYVTLAPTAPTVDSATAVRMRTWQLQYFVGRDPEHYQPDLRNWGPILLPPGALMTLGDNRDESFDCRYYGFVPRANLRGSPLLIYFSYDPNSWRPLPPITTIRWNRLFRSLH
jgi:signal peptidase I